MKKPTKKAANRIVYLISSAVLLCSGIISMPKLANAKDNYPCGKPTTNKWGETVQYCPITQGNVPVFDANLKVVGYLNKGGTANWFYCQFSWGKYKKGNLENNWWAYTRADNLQLGFVNEVYFKGGNNNERDAALQACD